MSYKWRRRLLFISYIHSTCDMLYGCPVADMALHVGQQLRTSTCPWLPNSLSHAHSPACIHMCVQLTIKHYTTRTCIIHLQQFAHEKQEEFCAHAKVIKKQWTDEWRDGEKRVEWAVGGETRERVSSAMNFHSWHDVVNHLISFTLRSWISFDPLRTWLSYSYDVVSDLSRV